MKPILTLLAVFLAGAVTLTDLAARSGPAVSGADVKRTVYFSALDSKGAHVTDLTAAELSVKEGGKDRAIDSVGPATRPMTLSILIDDAGSGGFQAALSQFIQATFGRAEYAFRILNPQAIKVQDFTQNGDDIRAVISRIGQRGRIPADGEQMIAGVSDAARELRQRKVARPAILALTVNGETALADTADEALKSLRDSGASLSVVHLTGIELGKVLGDGPKQSGGIIDRVIGNVAVGPVLQKVSANLLNQYMLTYTIPDGTKLNERFQLSTSRKDVKLIAPTRLPEK